MLNASLALIFTLVLAAVHGSALPLRWLALNATTAVAALALAYLKRREAALFLLYLACIWWHCSACACAGGACSRADVASPDAHFRWLGICALSLPRVAAAAQLWAQVARTQVRLEWCSGWLACNIGPATYLSCRYALCQLVHGKSPLVLLPCRCRAVSASRCRFRRSCLLLPPAVGRARQGAWCRCAQLSCRGACLQELGWRG